MLLGAPVLTADYDLWLHHDDIELVNAAFEARDHFANRSPAEARRVGRYVIENGERIDIVVAKAASLPDGGTLTFDEMWMRRKTVTLLAGVFVQIPSIDDLIATKRLGEVMTASSDEAWERRLAPEEFSAQEMGFLRRYPTPLERLAYSRRKYRESLAHRGLGLR